MADDRISSACRVAVELMRGEHRAAVVRLLQRHLRDIPPVQLSGSEIAAAIDDPLWFTRLHYPDLVGREGFGHPCFVGICDGEVVAAAQLLLPPDEKQAGLCWIAGLRDRELLSAFVRHIIEEVRFRGYETIADTRNPFGVGWMGTPECWPHVLEALIENGFKVRTRWQSYYVTDLPEMMKLPDGVRLRTAFDEARKELSVQVVAGSEVRGHVDVWCPPPDVKTFAAAGLADVEYVEVVASHRRKGLGLALLTAAMGEARRYGARSFMLWTEAGARDGSVAMQRLAKRAGFRQGPVFDWIGRSLI